MTAIKISAVAVELWPTKSAILTTFEPDLRTKVDFISNENAHLVSNIAVARDLYPVSPCEYRVWLPWRTAENARTLVDDHYNVATATNSYQLRSLITYDAVLRTASLIFDLRDFTLCFLSILDWS